MACALRVFIFALLQFSASVYASTSQIDDAIAMLQSTKERLAGQMRKDDTMLTKSSSARQGARERLAATQKMEVSMETAVTKIIAGQAGAPSQEFFENIYTEMDLMIAELFVEKDGFQLQINSANANVATCNTNRHTKSSQLNATGSYKEAADLLKIDHHTCREAELSAYDAKTTSCDLLASKTASISDAAPQCNCPLSDSDTSDVLTCLASNRNWVESYKTDLTTQKSDCDTKTQTWSSEANRCDALQSNFEEAVCIYDEKLDDMCSTLDTCYDQAISARTSVVANVRIEEEHLKTMLASAKKIVCFLNIVKQMDTQKFTMSDLEACKNLNVSTDTTYLNKSVLDVDLTYSAADGKATCQTLSSTPGDGQWAAAEYAGYTTAWLRDTLVCPHKTMATTSTVAPTTTAEANSDAGQESWQENGHDNWCGGTNSADYTYSSSTASGWDHDTSSDGGWRWCGGLDLATCKSNCLAMGDCVQIFFTHNSCCFPSKTVCSGSDTPGGGGIAYKAPTTAGPTTTTTAAPTTAEEAPTTAGPTTALTTAVEACLPGTVEVHSAQTGKGIDGGSNCGHKSIEAGDLFYGAKTASCTRFIICEGTSDCVSSGITTTEECAAKAAVRSECAHDYIEWRGSSHCFCNPAGRTWVPHTSSYSTTYAMSVCTAQASTTAGPTITTTAAPTTMAEAWTLAEGQWEVEYSNGLTGTYSVVGSDVSIVHGNGMQWQGTVRASDYGTWLGMIDYNDGSRIDYFNKSSDGTIISGTHGTGSLSFTATHVQAPTATTASCTCLLDMDNYIDAVYVDGVDVTAQVTGDLTHWNSANSISFSCSSSTLLAVQGGDNEHGCTSGGFAAKCTASDPASPWHLLEANTSWKAFGLTSTFAGAPSDWFMPTFDDSGWDYAATGVASHAASQVDASTNICSPDGVGWLFRSPNFA